MKRERKCAPKYFLLLVKYQLDRTNFYVSVVSDIQSFIRSWALIPMTNLWRWPRSRCIASDIVDEATYM